MNISPEDKKILQRRRIMRYFIEATYQIMEEEGLDKVTIRKISNLASYNSATLYNYFSSVDKLIAFSALRYLKQYSEDLKHYTSYAKDSYEQYVRIWECFCKHSFQHPHIYHKIFFKELNNSISTSIQEYYHIFPEDLSTIETQELKVMFTGESIEERTLQTLQAPIADGFFAHDDAKYISEVSILLYEGMLDKILSGAWDRGINAAVETFIHHLRVCLKPYLLK